MKYRIYFEFLGRNMVIHVEADSANDAIEKLRSKIKIHKIEDIKPESKRPKIDDLPDGFKAIFGL